MFRGRLVLVPAPGPLLQHTRHGRASVGRAAISALSSPLSSLGLDTTGGENRDQPLLCISFHFRALIELVLFYVRDERANQNSFLFLVNSLSLFQLFISVLYCSNRWRIKNEFTFWELYTVQLTLTI